MKNSTRRREAVFAAAVVAVVAAIVGIAAGQGLAAPPIGAKHGHGHTPKSERSKHPRVKHGVLTVKGTDASDKIALRLQAGRPDTLEVDFGDDGSADFRFERARIAEIAVDAESGDDSRAYRREQRRLHRQHRDDDRRWRRKRHDRRRRGQRDAARRRRERHDRRQRGQRRRLRSVPATTPSSGIPATAATPSRARTAATSWSSTGPTPTRGSSLSANGRAPALPPQPRQHHDGHERRRDRGLQRAPRDRRRQRRRPHRDRCLRP